MFKRKTKNAFLDKVVVITGVGSGIGQALARVFADEGATIVGTDKNPKGLEVTRRLLAGGAHLFLEQDVADRQSFIDLAATVKKTFGGADVIINNAGVALSQTVDKLKIEDFEWLMGINFWGVVYGTQAFLPDMLSRRSGTIVNISSLFGLIGVPTQSAYNASKFAVRGFTESLRAELSGTGVRAICVHPGGIKTSIAANARFYVGVDGENDAQRAAQEFERIARTSPAEAAHTILEAVRHGDQRVLIGKDAKVLDWIQRVAPVGYSGLLTKALSLSGKS
ncbi:MAG: SDR family NAD(P)-dependent oxidoreductase [Hahellaceae bacterium]|nr:SDR family NAD(P)-dependent oxidoreductase [Hahellaceae bacterium]